MSTRAKADKFGHCTLENEIYGVRWLQCRRCGMRSADVRDVFDAATKADVAECADATRCTRATLGQPLSDNQWKGKGPNDDT